MNNTIKGFLGKDGPIRLDYSGVANVPGAIQSIAELTAQPGDHFEVETVDSTGRVATVKAVAKPGGNSGQNPPQDGEDGFSPIATVTQTADGATITITDKDGTTTATVTNGKDGSDGVDGKDGYTPQKGVDYFDGQPGKDGSPGKNGADGNGIKSAVLNADYTLTLTFDDGTTYTTPSIRGATGATGSAGKDGPAGAAGKDGTDGVGIESIKQTTTSTADGGNNVFTVTLTNGTSATFTVKNGSKGSTGAAGKDGSDGQPGIPGPPGADGYTPVRGEDYWTPYDIATMDAKLAQMLAERAQLRPEPAENLEWLKANGDPTKLYVLMDKSSDHYGYIYGWFMTEKEVETGGGYTNLIDGTNGYIKEGYRYSLSSAAWKEFTAIANFASIVIPVPTSGDLTVRVRGMKYRSAYPSIYGGTTNSAFSTEVGYTTEVYDTNGDWYFTISNTSGASYIVTTGELTVDATDVIATVNEEIVEGGTEIVKEFAWANTGIAFVSTDYGPRVTALEKQTAQNTADIDNLKKGVGITTAIADWDAPIYDANIPVFQLSTEKAAMTNAANTPANIYAMYDALMARHPRYITRTDLGLCSDGVNHVYRYDFREPDPHYESGKVWSETKAKAILMTGVHFEWAGIYSLYYALEEIADNPELRNFRRNTHLIVVPVANPYATIASNYQSGLDTPNSYGVRNARGVEIHRNFEVDWILNEVGSTHYGGPEPLSEVETQYIDNILKANTDAAVFLSCHNCGVEAVWGTGFIWSSTATKYMCNMGFRLVDKMSDAWMDKYGDALSAGIEEYKTDALEDGDTRLGWAGLSTSPGTEAKQATKYGIQGTNIETCDPFQIHGTKANPEPSMSAFTMSRGAEVYVNFLLTAFGVYDPKDKKEYAPATV